MPLNRVCVTWVTIVGVTSPLLFSGSRTNAQTAACCLGDQCEELEQTPCEDGGGLWLGDRPSPPGPIMECAGLSCPAPPNDDCENATVICENLAVDPDAGWCDNVDLMDPGPICSLSQQDCYDGSTCVDWAYDTYRCQVPTDNRLASTDGPDACPFIEPTLFADVWYALAAPCDGELVISMCNAELQYDSVVALYGNQTSNPSCPAGPTDGLLDCNDDFCPGPATASWVQTQAMDGVVYLVRVGGWSPDWGETAYESISELDIGFLCDTPPMPPGLPTDGEHLAPKNRYLSIDASSNLSNSAAYELTLASMRRCSGDDRRACIVDTDCPGVCAGKHDLQCTTDAICGPDGPCIPTSPCVEHADVGNVVRYVNTPFARTCSPLDDCADQWFANLVDIPVFRVWSEDTLHITGCEIVPAALYEVRAELPAGDKSVPLMIGTILKPNVHYGDCVGPVVGGQYTAPDGFTNVVDVQAYLHAIQGTASAPHTTWVDLQGVSGTRVCEVPDDGCVIPQQILNVADLQTIKFGYLGQTYVATPGQENPGDCP